jgi:hypothetical protein
MSTRSTIAYNERIHIYYEMLDNTIHIKAHDEQIDLDLKLMTREEWEKSGLPLYPKKITEHLPPATPHPVSQ